MGWLAGYSKYKVLTITGGASGAQTNFQLKLAVSYEAAMQGDFDDIRFTQSDGTTLVDAWAELIVTDTSATVWVEFPTTPANTVDQIYRMYYGNAGAANYWDIGATFLFGDDFPGTSIDTNKWTVTGTAPAVSGGIMTQSVVNTNVKTSSFSTSTIPYAIRSRTKFTSNNAGFGFTDDACAGRAVFMWWFNAPGRTLTYSDGWSANNLYTANVYHNFDLIYDPNVNIIFKVDESIINTDSNNVPLNEYVQCVIGDVASTLYTDFIFVRKYAANPPTYAFGAEQSVLPGEAAPTSIFYGPFVGPFGGPL